MSYKKLMSIGPGGKNCICCFPAPSSKERKYIFRQAKRKDKKNAFKCEEI